MASDGTLIGYARVSTSDQKLDLQLDALAKAGVAKSRIYTDKAGGGPGTRRPGFAAAMKACRAGDKLVVWKLDRLGRSLSEVLRVMERLEEKGARVEVLTEKIDTSSATGRFVFHILASLAEMERGLIKERTKAGLTAAKARGRVGGRRRWKTTPETDAEAIRMLKDGKAPSDVAAHFDVSVSLVYQRMRGAWAEQLLDGGGK